MTAEHLFQRALAQVGDHLRDIGGIQQLVAMRIDDLALLVGHVVVVQQLLADVEVAGLDLALCGLDGARHQAGLDGLTLGQLQTVHDGLEAVTGEDLEQRIFHGQVEARRTLVTLATGTTTQLVVDTTGFVALGADDVQTALLEHFLVDLLPFFLEAGDLGLLGLGVQVLAHLDGVDDAGTAATQLDVGTPARHVGGDGDLVRPAGLRHDLGLAIMLLGVEHVVRQPGLLQQVGHQLGVLDGGGADQHRLATFVAVADVGQDGVVLFLGGPVDQILHVVAHHGPVRGHHHGLQVVDFLELVGLGVGRTGHAGQLLVHPEVVLEGDRGQRLVLGLDLHAFLGFHRLVQAIGPAPARHQAASELVDDDDLVVLHDIVLVTQEQRVRPQRHHQVMHQRDVGGVVQAGTLGQKAQLRQDLFGVLVASFGQVGLMRLVIHPVVARRIFLALFGLALHRREHGGHGVHPHVQFGVFLGRTGDDQRRARLVDQDRVHLVDDGVEQLALHARRGVIHHVVAQVVEAVLVVGTVGDVGLIGSPLLVGRLLGHDDAHRQTQEVVEPSHPGRVTLGQIVVDRDHVHAPAGQRIQIDRQRGGQRLALTSAHLGDLAGVQHHGTQHLHVEVTHAQDALRALATDCKGLGQDGVQHVVHRLAGCHLFLDARLELAGLVAQLVVGQRLHLWLQRIDARHATAVLFQEPRIAAAEDAGQ